MARGRPQTSKIPLTNFGTRPDLHAHDCEADRKTYMYMHTCMYFRNFRWPRFILTATITIVTLATIMYHCCYYYYYYRSTIPVTSARASAALLRLSSCSSHSAALLSTRWTSWKTRGLATPGFSFVYLNYFVDVLTSDVFLLYFIMFLISSKLTDEQHNNLQAFGRLALHALDLLEDKRACETSRILISTFSYFSVEIKSRVSF